MPALTFDRVLCVDDVGRTEVRINVHQPWEKYSAHLQRLLPEEIHASELWTATSGPVLVQQLLTGGPSFTMIPTGFVGPNHWLTRTHADYMRGARKNTGCQSLRVGLGVHPHRTELFLVPINALQGKARKTIPAFLGYLVPEGVTGMADGLIANCLLPVILDLDETLLVANSISQLVTQMTKANNNRDQASADAETAVTDQLRQDCQQREHAWMQEMQSLEQDLQLLKQFREDNTATSGGQIYRAKYEAARVDNNITLQRPVIRLPGGVVLTRIDPGQRDTSMIMRIRPGWDALRAFLAPALAQGQPMGKKRFDVYVCTAAERGYALEAWRLLDSSNDIIAEKERPARIVCVPNGQKKELRRVLRVQAPIAFESEDAEPQAACAMPLAVVVDDRLDVWEPESQAQVLQVAPFAPHRPLTLDRAQMSSPQAMQDEMAAVKTRMTAIRSNAYYDVNHHLKLAVNVLMRDGQPLEKVLTDVSQALPAIRTVADLLKVPNLQTPSPFAPGMPDPAPPAFVATDALRPQDPRQTQGPPPTAPAQQQPMPGPPAPMQPVDPRRHSRAAPMLNQPPAGAASSQPSHRQNTAFPSAQHASSSATLPGMPQAASQPQKPWSTQQHQRQQQQPAVGLSHVHIRQQQQQQQQPQLPPVIGIRQQAAAHQMPNGSHTQGQGPSVKAGQAAGAASNGPAPPAGNSPSRAVLHVDLALPVIRQQTARATSNPVTVLKEASDKQKADCRFLDKAIPAKTLGQHAHFLSQVTWEGQEIGAASGNDKKTARKEAAKKAIQFLLQYSPAASTSPAQQPSQPQATAQASASGAAAGSPKNQGAPAGHFGAALITESNALATLQQSYPKEVKYRTLRAASGRFCEAIDIMEGHYIVEATASTKKGAQRWAAMRLLMELNRLLDPTFFADTPEGRQAGSRGPVQDEFYAATQVKKIEGRAMPGGSKPNRMQSSLQSRQQQHSQQQQQQQQQQEQQPEQPHVSSDARHKKRAAVDDDLEVPHVNKRGKHVAHAAARLVHQAADTEVGSGKHDEDVDMTGQEEDLRDMSLEPAEQSGYPSHDSDEDVPSSGDAEEDEGTPAGSSGGGSGSSHTENDQPVDGVNMQNNSHDTFLAAVKKQSKVKEGAWSEVKQHYDEHDVGDGVIEID